MSTVVYVARVVGAAGTYQAAFADLPGVEASAGDLATLLQDARVKLLAELKRLEAAGQDWPEPTPLETLRERGGGAAETLVLVDLQVDDTPLRVNISIGERLLKRLDAAAEASDMSRSGFIAAAVRQRLHDRTESRAPGGDPSSQRLYEEVASVGRRLNETLGPDSKFGRALSDLDGRALDGLQALSSMMRSRGVWDSQRPPEPTGHETSPPAEPHP